jgi:hypothetical protein
MNFKKESFFDGNSEWEDLGDGVSETICRVQFPGNDGDCKI